MSENIVYQDKVKSSVVVVAVFGISICAVLLIAVILYFQGLIANNKNVLPILSVVMAVDLGILLTFKQMKIVITDKELKFGFYIFGKKIDLKTIESVEIQDFKFSTYFGYGIRYGRDNTIGYVPCGGRGLKVTVSNEKRPYFFICNRPEEALTFIKQYGKQK